ncbi:uncharacterized protein LOC135395099 [Ornithodoros turicata]|uniref:Putative nuclear pore complex component n=1 Tax=Ornithodoros turicata TaxID=34597 RepID=A0A2R5LAV7_9ACAR
MAKRRADKEMNHDNWEDDDEDEEPGQFKQAHPEEMKRRVIKIGRRSATNTPSPFSKLTFGDVNGTSNPPEFLGKLKSLNDCLVRWMKQHMENSPYCDFTPVFNDYQRHLQELKQKYHAAKSPKTTGFKSLPKLSLTVDSVHNSTGTTLETGEEAYVPPKNEFTAVQEEGAIYSKRCKLFYKKDNVYVDRGVGTLYLKPMDGKHQLLMRADTNLGNILLNILLVPALPVSRLGNNNVALVCVPNPPIPNSEGPTTLLLRVKTAQDADQLRETIDRLKETCVLQK